VGLRGSRCRQASRAVPWPAWESVRPCSPSVPQLYFTISTYMTPRSAAVDSLAGFNLADELITRPLQRPTPFRIGCQHRRWRSANGPAWRNLICSQRDSLSGRLHGSPIHPIDTRVHFERARCYRWSSRTVGASAIRRASARPVASCASPPVSPSFASEPAPQHAHAETAPGAKLLAVIWQVQGRRQPLQQLPMRPHFT
jgi:hypothetical protein